MCELPADAPHELRRPGAALRGRDAEVVRGRRRVAGKARIDRVREVQRLRGVEDLGTELEPRAAWQLERLGETEVHLSKPAAEEVQARRAAITRVDEIAARAAGRREVPVTTRC